MLLDFASSNASVTCRRATFARDGHIILGPEAHMRFMARSLLNLTLGVMRQLDPSVGAQVNSDTFLSAFSYDEGAGHTRQSLPPWVNGPGWRPSSAPSSSHSSSQSPRGEQGSLLTYALPDAWTFPAELEHAVPLVSQHEHVLPAARARWELFAKTYSAHIPWLGANRQEVIFPKPVSKQGMMLCPTSMAVAHLA
jgi:hypothetical protein